LNRWVWSPAGGWWYNPRHWARNSLAVGATAGIIGLSIGSWAASKENRLDIKRQAVVWSKNDSRYHAERAAQKAKSPWVYPIGKQPYRGSADEE
jgi:hypothetical protein